MRAQREVHAKDKAVFGLLADQTAHAAHGAHEIFMVGNLPAPVGQAAGFTIGFIDADQVNVAGDIELARAELAHADDP